MTSTNRPSDDHYWRRPWSSMLFAGDLFEAIPFSSQPTVAVEVEDEDGARKHYVGAIEFAYGLLVSPTCDMTDQVTGASAHPYRVLVPVVSLDAVCDALEMPADKRGLLRSRDQTRPYLYLPPVPGTDEGELVGLLFRPTTVDDFLRTPPRRLAQLHPLARRHLKVKLAAYWARSGVDHDVLPIFERDEERPEAEWPPSEYDPPDSEFAGELTPPEWDPDELSSGLAPPVA